jgi:hypothetical protein
LENLQNEVRQMSIRFSCPHCKAVIKAKPTRAGAKVACPKCGLLLTVPVPQGKILDATEVVHITDADVVPATPACHVTSDSLTNDYPEPARYLPRRESPFRKAFAWGCGLFLAIAGAAVAVIVTVLFCAGVGGDYRFSRIAGTGRKVEGAAPRFDENHLDNTVAFAKSRMEDLWAVRNQGNELLYQRRLQESKSNFRGYVRRRVRWNVTVRRVTETEVVIEDSWQMTDGRRFPNEPHFGALAGQLIYSPYLEIRTHKLPSDWPGNSYGTELRIGNEIGPARAIMLKPKDLVTISGDLERIDIDTLGRPMNDNVSVILFLGKVHNPGVLLCLNNVKVE